MSAVGIRSLEGREVGLRFLEFVKKAIFEHVDFVGILIDPLMKRPVACVADLEDAAAKRALNPEVPALRVGLLDVLINAGYARVLVAGRTTCKESEVRLRFRRLIAGRRIGIVGRES